MADKSAIEWTDATWNPVTGCTRVSPGCAHCYIERTPPFRIKGRKFARVGNAETTGVTLHPDRLGWPGGAAPKRRARELGRPIRVFVNSLSDLWHEEVPAAFVAEIFEAMAKAPEITFQVLTKRPERAQAWFDEWSPAFERFADRAWPLPNVWLGVSVENMRWVSRADVLRDVPAAIRFISAEPLLGPLVEWMICPDCGGDPYERCRECGAARFWPSMESLSLLEIDWLIVGGESGPGHRSMHVEWARDLCQLAELSDTAFFFKQWGGRTSKAGGRLLDGREWSDFPRALVAAGAADSNAVTAS